MKLLASRWPSGQRHKLAAVGTKEDPGLAAPLHESWGADFCAWDREIIQLRAGSHRVDGAYRVGRHGRAWRAEFERLQRERRDFDEELLRQRLASATARGGKWAHVQVSSLAFSDSA